MFVDSAASFGTLNCNHKKNMKFSLSFTFFFVGKTVEGFVVRIPNSAYSYVRHENLLWADAAADALMEDAAISGEMKQRNLLATRLEMEASSRSDAGGMEAEEDEVVGDVPVEPKEDEVAEALKEHVDDAEMTRRKVKASLFQVLGSKPSVKGYSGFKDPILADPETKDSLVMRISGALIGGQASSVKVILKSPQNTYQGSSSTYYDLLTDSSIEKTSSSNDESDTTVTDVINNLRVFIPPPLRNVLAMTNVLPGDDYIPMRDLFTSPQVSFAYERGWRQGFAAAGFPGADKEYEMVKEYFQPVNPDTVVDMSCATGLFTRRLAKGGDYKRVLGCDYSDSMLTEARRRIEADADLANGKGSTQLELVRCDVGNIPMGTETVPALHAGAAMHCWPDLDAALSEVYRVLKPGGRYFASTFLSAYFSNVQAVGGNDINSQAFQYFESVDMLRSLLVKAGFEDDKVDIEVLGNACVIIRAEK